MSVSKHQPTESTRRDTFWTEGNISHRGLSERGRVVMQVVCIQTTELHLYTKRNPETPIALLEQSQTGQTAPQSCFETLEGKNAMLDCNVLSVSLRAYVQKMRQHKLLLSIHTHTQ